MIVGHEPVIIIGAGPAGLTAAYELVNRGIQPIIIEKCDKVGGLARTEVYKGYRFDIGGHRFLTKLKEVQELWHKISGKEFIKVPRRSRIHYRGRFFNYPLDLLNTISTLGMAESVLIILSYLRARLLPHSEEETFEQWVTNRFGKRLYKTFFKSYTEKVWGLPCRGIQSDWASQRIRGLSLWAAVSNAIFRTNHTKTLISEFYYPLLGPGTMWNQFQRIVEQQGGQFYFNTEAIRLKHNGFAIREISVQGPERLIQISAKNLISSMALSELIPRLSPLPPEEVLEAARKLTYRAFTLVGLIIRRAALFPDQWIYVHSPELKVGRIQNFKNWSPTLVPDPGKTSLGMEYFCTEGDDIWRMSDEELIELAIRELVSLGMVSIEEIEDGIVFRQPKAYPVYHRGYHEPLRVIQHFLEGFTNLYTIGRNGLHRYNNQDHSMLTAMLAVENILGANHNLWELSRHQEYLEQTGRRLPVKDSSNGAI